MEKISVPAEYDGLSSGNRVVMMLGGSGDRQGCDAVFQSQEAGGTGGGRVTVRGVRVLDQDGKQVAAFHPGRAT